METMIMGYLAANVRYYEHFHTGEVLKDTESYFKFGMYCDNILDVIIVVTSRALNVTS